MARSQPAKPKDAGKTKASKGSSSASSASTKTSGSRTKTKVETKPSAVKRASTKAKGTKERAEEGQDVRRAETELTQSMIGSAVRVAKEVQASSILLYVDALARPEALLRLVGKKLSVILVARDEKEATRAREFTSKVLTVPPVNLTRMGQIKMATLLAFSQRMLAPGETFVCLVGVMKGGVDTMVVMSVGEEHEMFRTVDQPKITEHIRRAVFQRVLSLGIELAGEGREGKPVGALFVIGDQDEVQRYCHQTIINPFRGYPEEERNILDDNMTETVKEFCTIDGAFVISGRGVIISAGTTLRTAVSEEELPQGLGSRHAAAAAITANTRSVAISLSESTGTVRVWRRGELITEIEKASSTSPRAAGMIIPKDQ
jgi:diadenylate cyclase